MALQMPAVISRKCITNDEVISIAAGYYHLVAGNFQISMDHPPLSKMWSALPLLVFGHSIYLYREKLKVTKSQS